MWSATTSASMVLAQSVDVGEQRPILITAICVLGAVVAFLFKLYHSRQVAGEASRIEDAKAHTAKEAAWATERVQLVADHEAECAEMRASHAGECHQLRQDFDKAVREMRETVYGELRADRVSAREHEDRIRAEFADIMENVAKQQSESLKALHAVLDKFYDRFVGPRARSR